MEILRPHISLDDFFNELADAPGRLLMLDYDGTLAPFRSERDRAVPYEGVRERLRRLVTGSRTRLVIVSGRAIDDLTGLLDLDELPELWGCHGAEQYLPGRGKIAPELPAGVAEGLAAAIAWANSEQLIRYAERKPAGIAFHWRGLPGDIAENLRGKVTSYWTSRASGFGLNLHEFDGGLELRPRGIDKGGTVASALAKLPPGSAAAYLGDDITDEDAFNALEGRGLRVLVCNRARPTAADVHLIPPDELLAFLDRWLEYETVH